MTAPASKGALAHRLLNDDLEVVVYGMAFGNTRLVLSVPGAPTYLAGWCFHDTAASIAAAASWDGEGDPDGWYRRLSDDTRNPDHACAQQGCAEPSRPADTPAGMSVAGTTVST